MEAASSVPERLDSRVLNALRAVPRGEVVTYAELASLSGLDSGGRAPIVIATILNKAIASSSPKLPWWRVIRGIYRKPISNRLQPERHEEQVKLLRKEMTSLQMSLPPLREQKCTKLPRFLRQLEEDAAISPPKATHSLIYLHGFRGRGLKYVNASFLPTWQRFPTLRVVLPTARSLLMHWGERCNAWYAYKDRVGTHTVGDAASLSATRKRLQKLIEAEVRRVGDASRVFIGGCSQGCGIAFDALVHSEFSLGGFVGVVGWAPSDSDGFEGIDAAVTSATLPPLWFMNAIDDTMMELPFVEKSLARLKGRSGINIKRLSDCGHSVGKNEATFLEHFLSTLISGPSAVSRKNPLKRPAASR